MLLEEVGSLKRKSRQSRQIKKADFIQLLYILFGNVSYIIIMIM